MQSLVRARFRQSRFLFDRGRNDKEFKRCHSASAAITTSNYDRNNAVNSVGVIRKHEDVFFFEDIVTNEEHQLLLNDCNKRLQRKPQYLKSHFDSVIADYKESEMPLTVWSQKSQEVLNKLFTLAFQVGGLPSYQANKALPPHVIDLKGKTGVIYPHVDSIKHGGAIVAVLSLLSTRTMRLSYPPKDFQVGTRLQEKELSKENVIEYVLPPKSFYVLTKKARYDLAHEILAGEERRLSIVFRDQPENFVPDWAKEFVMGGRENDKELK
jgi:hypothetical protein